MWCAYTADSAQNTAGIPRTIIPTMDEFDFALIRSDKSTSDIRRGSAVRNKLL